MTKRVENLRTNTCYDFYKSDDQYPSVKAMTPWADDDEEQHIVQYFDKRGCEGVKTPVKLTARQCTPVGYNSGCQLLN